MKELLAILYSELGRFGPKEEQDFFKFLMEDELSPEEFLEFKVEEFLGQKRSSIYLKLIQVVPNEKDVKDESNLQN